MITDRITSELYSLINNSLDYGLLIGESKEYSIVNDIDYRVYLLGLKLYQGCKETSNYMCKLFKQVNDYKNVWSEFTIWMLKENLKNIGNVKVIDATNHIIGLLEKHGDDIPKSAAWAARSDARSAESAARSAARSAESAASAARSAEYAAESARSAAWSAEYAAESAARSAESAARSAAKSAAEYAARSAAEYAARSAAKSAAYKDMYNKLMEILEKRI